MNLISSEQGRRLSDRVKETCKLLDISLLDHIILRAESYNSFAGEGLIELLFMVVYCHHEGPFFNC
ncbi:hypothetical protein MM239_14330 [Belliella sp. DSM 111904]|uniref:RadC-like JAB domain-containing protein n=1 Tax=Belliella filtrata TaxID=2923435 RepID=A0ABS9V2D4_9BACT|nr:hypothetical protein [Belliella filtrata]